MRVSYLSGCTYAYIWLGSGTDPYKTVQKAKTVMTTTTATVLKNRLGAYLDAALTEPVFVQKSGRSVAVLVSQQHYAYLQALEDECWALRAYLAEQSGYVGADTTQQVLHDLLHKDDTC